MPSPPVPEADRTPPPDRPHRLSPPVLAVAATGAAVLTVVAAAVWSAPGGPSVASGPAPDEATAQAAASATPSPTLPDDALGPFDLVADPSPAAKQARVDQVDASRQQHLGTCMAAVGRTYEPLDLVGIGGAPPTPEALGLDEATFVRKHGYGYAASVDPDLVGPVTSSEELPGGLPSLPESQQDAYLAQLGTCWDEAVALYPDPTLDPAVAEQIVDVLEAEPEVAEAEERWAACMGDRGFDYADRDEIFVDLEQRMAPVRAEEATLGVPPGDAASLPRHMQRLVSGVRDHEVRVATADAACKAPLDAAIAEVEQQTAAAWQSAGGDLRAFVAEVEADR